MSVGEFIGSLGVTLLLVAFVLNLLNKLALNSITYLLLNVIGAALAGISSYIIQFWPFVILESVWMLASLIPMLKKLK
ncbi:MAG: hypothetical protein JNM96_08155 [Bacteroidia bacterium]|nr:hypothetical protein [Bacteroidia bacterium]